MQNTIKLIAQGQGSTSATGLNALKIDNTTDPRTLSLANVTRIDLSFPKFTDGRAYSQAFMLRRRMGFKGEIRATGDVLIDQLVQMQRSGFDAAELRADQDLAFAQAQFDRFSAFYQGDAVQIAPLFAANSGNAKAQTTAGAAA